MTHEALLEAAREGRLQAYAPYSRFMVGAALLGEDGHVYTGCNVENASYGIACCAERVALYKAVSEGQRRFMAIAIVGAPEGEEPTVPCPPCGICRQALYEFGGESLQVVLADGADGVSGTTLGTLLPNAFGPDNI